MKLKFFLKFQRDRSPLLVIGAILALGLITALLGGCGKKGPVRPKLDTVPAAPEDVRLIQQGRHFLLSWSIPRTNLDGSPAEDLDGFRIKRLVYDAEEGCPTCRDPDVVVAEIDLRYPEPAQQVGDLLYWRDFDINSGNGYRYAIAPVTVGGDESPPVTIHLLVTAPVASPPAPRTTAGDQEVLIEWDAPPLSEGDLLLGYHLYRRLTDRDFSPVPVNKDPLQVTRLRDRGLVNGRTYEYRVSALIQRNSDVLESLLSPGTAVIPAQAP